MFGSNKPAFGNTTFGGVPTSSGFSFGTPQASTGGGLFGTQTPQQSSAFTGGNLFGQASQANTSFAFGTTNTAQSGGLFGGTQQPQQQGGLFGSSTFGQSQPAASTGFSFGGGDTARTSSLFGGTPASSSGGGLFGTSTSGGLFGATTSAGTAVKFIPEASTDTVLRNGVNHNVHVKMQCITAMAHYKERSLEELRCEDYIANRKGPQAGATSTGSGLFGSTATTQSSLFGGFNASKPTALSTPFQTSTTSSGFSFGAASKPLFGAPTTTTASTFTFGAPSTSTTFGTGGSLFQNKGLFGTTTTTQSSLFSSTSAAPAFSFGQTTQSSSLFSGQKPLFGATTTTTPSFGFGQPQQTTSLFGGAATSGFGTGTSLFGATASTAAGGLFGASKPTFSFGSNFGGATTTTSAGFSLFNKPQTTAAPFGGFGSTTTNMFNPQQPQQQAANPLLNQNMDLIQQQLFSSPSFAKYISGVSDDVPKEALDVTNPAVIRGILKKDASPQFRRNFASPDVHPKPMYSVANGNYAALYSALCDGLDSTANQPLPKRNAKKLSLTKKSYQDSSLGGSSLFHGQSAASFVQAESFSPRARRLDLIEPRTSRFESTVSDLHDGTSRFLLHDPDLFLNNPDLPNGDVGKPNGAQENFVNDTFGFAQPPMDSVDLSGDQTVEASIFLDDQTVPSVHPAGIRLKRHGYETKPPLADLKLDEDGDCLVTDFEISRSGYGKIIFFGLVNLANLDLDELVHIRRREVSVYPDDSEKPRRGEGLNRKAEISLEHVYPKDKNSHELVTDESRLEKLGFSDYLERKTLQMGAVFKEYQPETGTWVFQVDHFSKYGLLDSDSEDEQLEKIQKLKQLKETETKKKTVEKSAPKQIDVASQSFDESQEFIIPSESEPETERRELVPQRLQAMKYAFLDETRSSDEPNLKSPPFQLPLVLRQSPGKKMRTESFGLEEEERTAESSMLTDRRVSFALKDVPPSYPQIPSGMEKPEPETRPPFRIASALLPYRDSVSCGRTKNISDFDLFLGRSTRCGVGPDNFTFAAATPTENTSEVILSPSKVKLLSLFSPMTVEFYKLAAFPSVNLPLDEVQTHIIRNMEVALANSAQIGRPATPRFQVNGVLEPLHRYIDRCPADFSFEHQIWSLCVALWGNIEEFEFLSDSRDENDYLIQQARRNALSVWLQHAVDSRVEEESNTAIGQSNHAAAIFSLISGRKAASACELAGHTKNNRLSLLLAESPLRREIMQMQLRAWQSSGADEFISDDYMTLYTMLAGLTTWRTSDTRSICVCERLDWLRCFAMQFWYFSDGSMLSALNDYQSAFVDVEQATCPPIPDYLNDEDLTSTAPPAYDLRYQLLCLYADRAQSLDTLLSPFSHTSDCLDFSLSWHLWQVLQALGYSHLSEHRDIELHQAFAVQLESIGLPHWAVFVALHITDDSIRKQTVVDILNRNVDLNDEEGVDVEFLQEKLSVPVTWIAHAKAVKARSENLPLLEAECLLKAGRYNECHTVLMNVVAPELIIDRKYEALLTFLDKLHNPENVHVVQNWLTGGNIFRDFILFHNDMQFLEREKKELDPEVISNLVNRITLLCQQVQKLKSSSPMQKLAVSKVSAQLARYLRIISVIEEDQQLTIEKVTSMMFALPSLQDTLRVEMETLLLRRQQKMEEGT